MRYSHRRLRAARKEAGLSLIEAAKRASLQRKHLELLEAGVSIPKADTLAKIACAYDKPIDFFFEKVAA